MGLTALIIAAIVTLILCTIGDKFYRFYLFCKRFNKLPGPKYAIPFFGAVFEFIALRREDQLKWFKDITDQYEDGFFQHWMGMTPVVHIHKPEHLEKILQSPAEITKPPLYEYFVTWMGRGLFTSTGAKWSFTRKFLTPAFHFSILEDFTEVMVDKTAIFKSCIERAIKIHGDKPFDVRELSMLCSLDIICETSLGINIRAQEDINGEYRDSVKALTVGSLYRFYRPWLKPDWIFYKTAVGKSFKAGIDCIQDLCTRIIMRKQEERKSSVSASDASAKKAITGKRKRKAFIDLMLEANEEENNPLTLEDLRSEAKTFMFAGHDTTGGLISWSLFCMGNEPDIQRKVHEELDNVLGDSDNDAIVKLLPELRYLERVIKEVLRLYPSAPVIGRCLQNDMQIGDYDVPAGTIVTIQIHHLHRDPAVWPDPLRFDPDRFLPENVKKRHPFSYIPFSAGPRNCIGQKYAMLEAKIILAQILRHFSVKSVETYSTMKTFTDLVLTPIGGIYVTMTKR